MQYSKKAVPLQHQNREMAEWSIAAVLKTVDLNRSGGSNPSLSTKSTKLIKFSAFLLDTYKRLYTTLYF